MTVFETTEEARQAVSASTDDEVRDAIAVFLSEMDHGDIATFPPSAWMDDADAIVDLLRAHRDETLQALGGERLSGFKECARCHERDEGAYPAYPVVCRPHAWRDAWVFGEAT